MAERKGGRSQDDRSAGDWMDGFLRALGMIPNVRFACKAVAVAPSTVYARRDADPEFRLEWDEAREGALDSLEALSWEAALRGDVRERQFLLKAYRPEQFTDRLRVKPDFPDGEEGEEFTFLVDSPALALLEGGDELVDVEFETNGQPSSNGKE